MKYLYHVQMEKAPERERVVRETATNLGDNVIQLPVRRAEDKIGRNDLCPCGSGKKYKNCCGRRV